MATGGTDPDLTFQLAYALLQMERIADARPLIDQYRRLKGDPKEPTVLFLEAILDEHTGHTGGDPRAGGDPHCRSPTRSTSGSTWGWAAATSALGNDRPGDRPFPTRRRGRPQVARAAQGDRRAAREPGGPRRGRRRDPARPEGRRHPSLRVAMAIASCSSSSSGSRRRSGRGRLRLGPRRPPRRSPGNHMVAMFRARRLADERQGRGGASSCWRRRPAADPQKSALWVAWSDILAYAGRVAEAQEVLARASRPDHAGDLAILRIARARLLLSLGHGRQARDLLRWARAQTSNAPPPVRPPDGLEGPGASSTPPRATRPGAADYIEWQRLLPDDPRPRIALLQAALVGGRRDGDPRGRRVAPRARRGERGRLAPVHGPPS